MVCSEPFTPTPSHPQQLAGVNGTEWSLLAPVGVKPMTDLINTLRGPMELRSHGLALSRNRSSSAQAPCAGKQLTRKADTQCRRLMGFEQKALKGFRSRVAVRLAAMLNVSHPPLRDSIQMTQGKDKDSRTRDRAAVTECNERKPAGP